MRINISDKWLTILCFILVVMTLISCSKSEKQLPNIIIIYADDMGYGDLNCQNPDSNIPTPHLDKLASEGMRFTDAHSSSGICSPSRFALLTGSYHWRRQHGIVTSFGQPFFNDTDITLPQILKSKNYNTACIGKWHLGWNWQFKNPPTGKKETGWTRTYYRYADVDWRQPISGGPLDRGFDYYFGDGTINFPPYTWIENDSILISPTGEIIVENMPFNAKEGNWEFRPGPAVPDWNPYDVLPTLTDKAIKWVRSQEKNKPFFLYFSLPSPHAPIIPNDEFIGKSEAGAYGDFMYQTDWVAGQVLKALEENDLEKETIVIYTSDNGPERYAFRRAETYEHFSMGEFRGLKRDVWEGGHRVPFIIKWPEMIEAGTVSNEVISQVDIMATLAAITEIDLPENSALDSYDLSPVLTGEDYLSPLREATVHNTFEQTWGLRQGDWLYINNQSGEHSKMPDSFKDLRNYQDFKTDKLLFNMEDDPGQRVNLSAQYPGKIKDLDDLLQKYREQGYSIRKPRADIK